MPSTFAVDSVEIGKKIPESISIVDSAYDIEKFWSERNNPALEFETGKVNHGDLVWSYLPNAFLGTVIAAYNQHLPLIFSPDDFWLVISLGVAHFLGQKENAEKYRKTFVDHEGKLAFSIDGDEFGIKPKSGDANNDRWPLFVAKIFELIKQHTKTDTAKVMTERFSTTGDVEATAFQVSLMETMKNYYQYSTCRTMCGIPEVTLEGNEEDYVSIIDRIDALISLLPDFEWYLMRVKDHMNKILVSFRGNPDVNWWSRIVHIVPGQSGGRQKHITGWLNDFFPHVFVGSGVSERCYKYGADITDFRSPAVTFTPVTLEDRRYTQKKYDMKLVGGFIGTAKMKTKDGKTALRPAIGWLMFYWKEEAL